MTAINVVDLPRARPANYLEEGHTLWSWLSTTDHKRIGILYAISITVFFFIARRRDRPGAAGTVAAQRPVSDRRSI